MSLREERHHIPRVDAAVPAAERSQVGRLFYVRDHCTNDRFPVDIETQFSALFNGHAEPRALLFWLSAANDTSILTYGTRQLEVNLGLRRRYIWTFGLVDFPTIIPKTDFLRHYELLVGHLTYRFQRPYGCTPSHRFISSCS